MRTDVKLDDQQVKELEQIYDRTLEQFKEIHKRLDAEGRTVQDQQIAAIKAILRPTRCLCTTSSAPSTTPNAKPAIKTTRRTGSRPRTIYAQLWGNSPSTPAAVFFA